MPIGPSFRFHTIGDLIDGCLAHQCASGLFHNVVDDPTSFEETNLAQMLAYSIYESVRGGWLPRHYLPAADRMRLAARARVDVDGFVQGVCGAPHFDKPGISAEGQAFFLMMEARRQNWDRDRLPESIRIPFPAISLQTEDAKRNWLR